MLPKFYYLFSNFIIYTLFTIQTHADTIYVP